MPNGIGPKTEVLLMATFNGAEAPVHIPITVGEAYELTFGDGTHTIAFRNVEDIHRMVVDITHPSLITALEENEIEAVIIDFKVKKKETDVHDC